MNNIALISAIEKLNLSLSENQYNQINQYLQLLTQWNHVYNLTKITHMDKMISHHIIDSLSVIRYIQANNILDVGSGAGLPGIPLAIYFPTKNFSLLDSNQKKTRFLQQVKATLKLDNVEVFHQRLDQLKSENCYDIVISRAFGSFDDMLPSIKLLCDNGGKIFSMKGQYDTIMQETVPKQLKVDEIIELETSTTNMNRHLVILSPDFILESEGSNSGNR